MLLIINGSTLFTTSKDERVRVYVRLLASFSMLGLVYHRRKVPVVEHISSRCPSEHTDTIPEGDCVTIPTSYSYLILYLNSTIAIPLTTIPACTVNYNLSWSYLNTIQALLQYSYESSIQTLQFEQC